MLLKVAVGLLVVAALFGVVILTAILSDKKTPKFAVVMHGFMAFAALISAALYVYYGHRNPLLITGLTLLSMAALGGLTLLSFDLSKKPIPRAFALGHPVLALLGTALLVVCFFNSF